MTIDPQWIHWVYCVRLQNVHHGAWQLQWQCTFDEPSMIKRLPEWKSITLVLFFCFLFWNSYSLLLFLLQQFIGFCKVDCAILSPNTQWSIETFACSPTLTRPLSPQQQSWCNLTYCVNGSTWTGFFIVCIFIVATLLPIQTMPIQWHAHSNWMSLSLRTTRLRSTITFGSAFLFVC